MGRAALAEQWAPIAERVRMYSSVTVPHSGGSVVLVQGGFGTVGPVAASGSYHANLGGQLARETVTRNG